MEQEKAQPEKSDIIEDENPSLQAEKIEKVKEEEQEKENI